jgi:hypothetical protein
MASAAILVQVRFEIVERGVPPNVAVKLTVEIVAWVTDLGAPNLLACLNITGKNCSTVWTNNRGVNAIAWPRIAIQYGVCVADKILNTGIF